jgi:hypothetical protein
VSVDTYLKGKNTSRYVVVEEDDVRILLSPKLVEWAQSVKLDVRQRLIRKAITVDVEHRHGPHCRH